MVHAGPPAQEVQQVHGIAAQGGFRQAAHAFAIQEAIDPFHFAAHGLLDDAKWALCVAGSPVNGSPGRSWARLLQQALELLGIAALDEEAVRIVPIG